MWLQVMFVSYGHCIAVTAIVVAVEQESQPESVTVGADLLSNRKKCPRNDDPEHFDDGE